MICDHNFAVTYRRPWRKLFAKRFTLRCIKCLEFSLEGFKTKELALAADREFERLRLFTGLNAVNKYYYEAVEANLHTVFVV